MAACNTAAPENRTTYLIVGSYSSANDEGIKVYAFNTQKGEATYLSGLKGIENPSFVYPSADPSTGSGQVVRVYAVGENFEAAKGTAHALSFDAAKGQLALLNTQPTHGDAPCNIVVSPPSTGSGQAGKWLYTSNYNGGSITEFPIDNDGKLGEGRVIAFSGASVDSLRQTQPHLHAVNFTPDGRFLLANDLGTDCIHVFPAAAPLNEGQKHDVRVAPGVGPRHLCFAPNGERAYLLGEISGDVVTLDYDASAPVGGQPFSVSGTFRADSLGAEGSADIHISADGRFVYTSHRLQGDGVSILRVGPDGQLEKVGYQPTGVHPRNFTISPDGKWLLVACRDSNIVQIFSRDAETGLLTDTGRTIEMEKPVCLQWIE